MRFAAAVLAMGAAALPALGGAPGVGGAVTGFTLDPRSHSIRPINGLPGSATLGAAVDLGFPVDSAAFSSQGGLAVVWSGGAAYLAQGLGTAAPAALALGVSMENPVAVLNAAGSAAVLYSASERRLQVVTGLSGDPAVAAPVVSASIDVSSLPGTLSAAAVDGSGSAILLGLADSGAGAVYLVRGVGADSAPVFLFNSASPSAILYVHRDRDALVADRSSNQIFLVGDVQGSAAPSVLAQGSDGVSGPVGMQLSADRTSVLVANAVSSSVSVHSLQGAAPVAPIPLPAAPSKLDRLNNDPVFTFQDMSGGSLFLFDEAGGRQVFFVPLGNLD